MQSRLMVRLFGLAAIAAGALALAGCMGERMTYGTGTTPGKVTVEGSRAAA